MFVLFLELFGSTCTGQNVLWERKCGRDKCEYLAKCRVSKKELRDRVVKGEVVNVEEIAAREKGEVGAVGQV